MSQKDNGINQQKHYVGSFYEILGTGKWQPNGTININVVNLATKY